MSFNDIPSCVLQYLIDNYLFLIDIIHLIKVNKKCNKLKVKDFFNVNSEYIKKRLCDDILKKHEYIEKLDAHNNPNILDISYLIHLKVLKVSGSESLIDSISLKTLINLEELDISSNFYVTNLNHLVNLKKLIAPDSQLNNENIKNLVNLEELNISNNFHITKINHCINLKVLTAYNTKLKNESIKDLVNLETLVIIKNKHITRISHLNKLKVLTLVNCVVNNEELMNLYDLEVLNVTNNVNIINIGHLVKLKVLYAAGKSGITDNSIKYMNIEKIHSYMNLKITSR